MYRMGILDHTVPMQGRTSAAASSAGVADTWYGPVPEGFIWYVERVSVYCPTSAAAVALYVSTSELGTDLGSRADYTSAGANAIADEFNPIYLPEGYYLHVQWTAATSGDRCTSGVQYAVHEKNPGDIMNPVELRQVAAMHQHPTAEVNVPATAHQRAV